MNLVKKKFKLEKELKLNTLVCAIVKTIGLLVGIVLLACCMAGCMYVFGSSKF